MPFWVIVWDPNRAINIEESTCGGGQLERFYCICIELGICVEMCICLLLYIPATFMVIPERGTHLWQCTLIVTL